MSLTVATNQHFELSDKEMETLKTSLLSFISHVSEKPYDYPYEALRILPELVSILIA